MGRDECELAEVTADLGEHCVLVVKLSFKTSGLIREAYTVLGRKKTQCSFVRLH